MTARSPISFRDDVQSPPWSAEAESAVLCAMMLGKDAIATASDILRSEDFYRLANGTIFASMVGMHSEGIEVDPVTLSNRLEENRTIEMVGGRTSIAALMDFATTTANLKHHAEIVLSKARLRRVIDACRDTIGEAHSGEDSGEVVSNAEARILAACSTGSTWKKTGIAVALRAAVEAVSRAKGGDVPEGNVRTGIGDLDRATLGLAPGELAIAAGRPGMGKTSLAVGIAEYAATMDRIPVLVFSLEMSAEQVAMRMASSRSGIDLFRLRSGRVSKEEWPLLTRAVGELSLAPIEVDDSATLTVSQFASRCRRAKAEGALGLAVVDYLQLMSGPDRNESRVQEISAVTRGLKAVARELGIPVLALSQLSRAAETREKLGRPQLSDLRESGTIEQDADLVVMLYREGLYSRTAIEPNRAELIVAKQRNGPTGTVDATWHPQTARFLPYSPPIPDGYDSRYGS